MPKLVYHSGHILFAAIIPQEKNVNLKKFK